MRRALTTGLALYLALGGVLSSPVQVQAPFELNRENISEVEDIPASAKPPRQLRGRFLHITDMHPDPLYQVGGSVSSACHRNKPKKDTQRAGYLGTPYKDCDSPLTLTDYTLDYLEQHWAEHIDFVIWTGDSARHDNDRKNPRTPKNIYDLNRQMTKRMEQIFLSKGIPVVPTIGNNDVWRPNSITLEYSTIWKSFIPFSSYGVFQRGGYFIVDVIPDTLAAISLNTMYFYDSNKAVGGCEYTQPNDPGNLQLDWLGVQLGIFRDKGISVWLMGHIPPTPDLYFPECYYRYTEISLRFQDTIVGHLFGHMNIDHVNQGFDTLFEDDITGGGKVVVEAHKGLDKVLLKDFSELPEDVDYGDYGVINVSPSVVPTYFPSFRVFNYNISAEAVQEALDTKERRHRGETFLRPPPHGHRKPDPGKPREKQCKKAEFKDSWRCHFSKGDWHSDPEAPSRKNGLMSPLGFAQYYLPDVENANETYTPKWELEYMTYGLSVFEKNRTDEPQEVIPRMNLPKSLRNGGGGKYAPYSLNDLTIPSWIELARKLGNGENRKLRKKFREYMFMGHGEAV
ncbi:hypothetical protein BDM02DRAFT_3156429 [Thelephora ganbajun]|uniref:Uncharacterized protein n=1 Tax=Thelephora ganbajun TaxID=370292 RepID=A0ACB6ZB72_THEGA|nr:hypothetical protein BDM02DRAFT_3156429 [Thelephora ganbajun]